MFRSLSTCDDMTGLLSFSEPLNGFAFGSYPKGMAINKPFRRAKRRNLAPILYKISDRKKRIVNAACGFILSVNGVASLLRPGTATAKDKNVSLNCQGGST
jgi:hypothetical protein